MVTKFLNVDTDDTLAANSNERVPSQKAVKSYTDTKQPKTLSNPITVGGVTQTTVEGTLTALASNDFLPSQTGQNGKFLTTNGSSASWDNLPTAASNQLGVVKPDGTTITVDASGTLTAVETGPTVRVDNETIIADSDEVITTVAVQESNNLLPISEWVGTKQEFDSIQVKNPNKKYIVKDEVDTIQYVNNYHIGQIFQSLLPLNDLGLHLLDGSLLDNSGIYSDFVSYIAGLYNNTNTYSLNVNLVGSITENNGVINNFLNNANYAKPSIIFPFSTSTNLNLTVKIDVNDLNAENVIIGNAEDAPWSGGCVLRTQGTSRLYLWGTTDNANWTTSGFDTGIDLTLGTNYISLIYDGTSYKVAKSIDGSTTTIGNIVTTTPFTNTYSWFGSTGSTYSYYLRGSIDLKECKYIHNNETYWLGVSKSGFTLESIWQNSVSTYGVCGKFVYDNINNSVRLPKVTGFVEGTLDSTALGSLIEAGLPNITGGFGAGSSTFHSPSGAFTLSGTSNPNGGSAQIYAGYATFNAANSNAIYGKSSTVQPQSIKAYLYIVIANSYLTPTQINLNNVISSLNNKVDLAFGVLQENVDYVIESYINGSSWYRIYKSGWCEQGGVSSLVSGAASTNIYFLKTMADTGYNMSIVPLGAYTSQAEANDCIYAWSTTGMSIACGHYAPQYFSWRIEGKVATSN